MASLSWIDFDETERQRAARLISMFNEKSVRDELGFGPIRDSIADLLFPGTSTLQTRLRYVFFVPWICEAVEGLPKTPVDLRKEARERQLRLISALVEGGEKNGVIGRLAQDRLRQLPSDIYWSALRAWGICLFKGTQREYFRGMPSVRNQRLARISDEHYAERNHRLRTWHDSLPLGPPDLLEKVSFELRCQESDFLIDRIVSSQPNSLLAHLAKNGQHAECNFVWQHPNLTSFPPFIRRLVRHAEVFSEIALGASLLYNLMLAEKREKEDWINDYRSRLANWFGETDLPRAASWDLEDFWSCVSHASHAIREPVTRFVQCWLNMLVRHQDGVFELTRARNLVRNREMALKGARSRFSNQSALDQFRGAAGASRFDFRWLQARSHIRDIVHAG